MERIDRLNIEHVLRVVGVADVKVRVVLKGDADQIADRILRRLAPADVASTRSASAPRASQMDVLLESTIDFRTSWSRRSLVRR